MKRKLSVLICFALLICLLPFCAFAGVYEGDIVRITARSAVNVRSQPSADSRMVGEAASTNTYELLGRSGDWYFIQFTSDICGYIPVRYAEQDRGLLWDDYRPDEVEAVVRNTHRNALNVRIRPDLDSPAVDNIAPGSTHPFCGTENGWHRILLDGRYVYVAANRTEVEVIRYIDSVGGSTSSVGSEPCDVCQSTGECLTCDNRGYVWGAVMQEYVDCPSCCGLQYCGACGGDGWR